VLYKPSTVGCISLVQGFVQGNVDNGPLGSLDKPAGIVRMRRRKMKKITFSFLLAVSVSLLAVSCSTTKVFDKSIPVEETAEIEIMNSIYLITFNGENVSKKYKTPNLGTLKLRIPAGQHNLSFNIFYSDTKNVIRANDLRVRYNFKPGHNYIVRSDPPFLLVRSGGLVSIDIVDLSEGITDGLLTINGLDEFNGKYIAFSGQLSQYTFLMGSKGKQGLANDIGILIENGTAEIPVFSNDMTASLSTVYGPFSGNATITNVIFYIGDEELFNRRSISRSKQYTINRLMFIDAKTSINFSDLTPK